MYIYTMRHRIVGITYNCGESNQLIEPTVLINLATDTCGKIQYFSTNFRSVIQLFHDQFRFRITRIYLRNIHLIVRPHDNNCIIICRCPLRNILLYFETKPCRRVSGAYKMLDASEIWFLRLLYKIFWTHLFSAQKDRWKRAPGVGITILLQ